MAIDEFREIERELILSPDPNSVSTVACRRLILTGANDLDADVSFALIRRFINSASLKVPAGLLKPRLCVF